MATGIALVPGQHRHLNLSNNLWPHEEILLVELPEAVLDVTISDGACFKTRGGPGDPLVFCTHNQTFTCKHVETTNTLLLCDTSEEASQAEARALANIDDNVAAPKPFTGLMTQVEADMQAIHERGVEVQGMTNFTVEASKRDPPLAQLGAILMVHRYGAAAGDDMDDMEPSRSVGLLWSELQDTVLASDCQIVDALQALQAIGVPSARGHRWCSMDSAVLTCSLDVLMMTCIEHGLCLSSFDPHHLLRCLADSPDELSQELLADRGAAAWHALRCFATSQGSPVALCASTQAAPAVTPATAQTQSPAAHLSTQAQGTQPQVPGTQQLRVLLADPTPGAVEKGAVMAFDSVKCARQCARSPLQKLAPGSPWLEFLAAWDEAVPALRHWVPAGAEAAVERCTLKADILSGLALVEMRGAEPHTLRPFFADCLPRQASERFRALYRMRAYWTAPDIAPYLEGVYDEGRTGTTLLLTYARASKGQGDEPTLYSAR